MARCSPVVFTAVAPVVTRRPLPFVLVSQQRAGAAVVQTALAAHSDAYCHGELLHPADKVRRRGHEAYFGPEADPEEWPDYCAQVQPDRSRANPERYLDGRVFATALNSERAVGVKLTYSHVWHSDLWEYLAGRARVGLFGVVHVVRNPLVCLVSQLQARASRLYSWREGAAPPRHHPSAVHVDPDEFVDFARRHEADAQRVRNLAPEALVVKYADLVCRQQEALARVFRYLELPNCPAARPTVRRLPNKAVRARVANFDAVRNAVPQNLRQYFETDLF